MHERQHHLLQLALAHLPVAHHHPRRRHQLLNLRGNLVNRLHAVVDEVNLPAALQLHLDRACGSASRRTSPPPSESPCDPAAASRSRSYRAAPPATCAASAESASPTSPAHRSPAASASAAPCAARRSAAPHPPPAAPGSWNLMSFDSSRCVPIKMSTRPVSTCSRISFCSFARAEARDHLHRDRELPEPVLESLEMLEAQHRRRRQHRHLTGHPAPP